MKPISLSELINYVWENSDFYRQFWKRRDFNPDRDFRGDSDLNKIPILTKEDLLSVSLSNRTIKNIKNCHYFVDISSGTTIHPLIVLKTSYAMPPYFRFIEKLDKGRRSSCLILRPPTYATAFLSAGLQGHYFPIGSIISNGNINDLVFSANLAKKTETDWIMGRPSDVVRFATVLKNQGYPPYNIKSLYITGEPITFVITSLLENAYPNALILYAYAMTEGPSSMGLKSSLCNTLNEMSPGSYHLNSQDFIFESIKGLSVVTALHKMPTPLIRYNTGDHIIIKDNVKCSCGFQKSPIGIIGSRENNSSYKIGGYTFKVDAIKSALKKMPELVTEDFKLQIEQISDGDTFSNILHFTLKPIGSATSLLTEIVSDTLKKEFYVTQYQSLGNAIRQGSIKPIEIKYDSAIAGNQIIPPAEIAKLFL